MKLDATNYQLIRCLSDDSWISGAQLAQDLGLSREAISKRMSKLQELQLPIERQAGRGYRLMQAIECFEHETMARALSGEISAQQLSILPSTESTNRYLAEHPELRLCLAEHQSAGRGRQGRNWHSPFGQNLYLSLRVELSHWPEKLPALGLALGVALCRCFENNHHIPLKIKWPNDLYLNQRKCGGMLIEQRGEAHGHCQLIIGIGLNILMQNADIDQQWTSLHKEGYTLSRQEIALSVAHTLLQETKTLDNRYLDRRLAEFSHYDVFDQQAVSIVQSEQQIHGHSRGIDEWGRLILETTQGLQKFSVGDVSLRPQT